MVYRITYFDMDDGREIAVVYEEHECNWLSEVNVIVGNGLEEGYKIMVERIRKE